MKQIYKVIQYQKYDISINKAFKKEIQQGWCIRNPHFIYAEKEEEAKEKYLQRFGLDTSSDIFSGWGAIVDISENSGDLICHPKFSNIRCFIDIIDFTGRETAKQLMADMNAFEFKEWWFDNND